jgi:hypothetical protein
MYNDTWFDHTIEVVTLVAISIALINAARVVFA